MSAVSPLAEPASSAPFAPPRAIFALHHRYTSASQTRRIVTPREASLRRIGHFGFFRPDAQHLWDAVASWLDQQTLTRNSA